MPRFLGAFAVCGVGALLAAGAGPVAAGTTSVTVGSWSATVTVPDHQWTSHDCEYVPVSITITGPELDEWSLDAEAMLHGSGSSTASTFAFGDTTGTFTDEGLFMCPGIDPNGVYDVTGEVEIWSIDMVETSAPVATTFTMSPMPTSISLDDSFWTYPSLGSMEFSGRAVAHSSKLGDIGVESGDAVTIEALLKGTWTEVGSGNTDQLGYFTVTVYQLLPADTAIRAVHPASSTGARSVSTGYILPDWRPIPKVTVKAKNHKSRLFVDVNPNKGTGYWKFVVQKKRPNGSWKSLKTYRTLGAKETRTIDLRKGTYRVKVKAKYGYRAVTSGPVRLKR